MKVKPNFKNNRRRYSKSRATLRNRNTNTPSDTSLPFLDDEQVDQVKLQFYRQKIEALTDIVQELQIQNEKLGDELFQCQENVSNSESSLRIKVKQMTEEISILKNK